MIGLLPSGFIGNHSGQAGTAAAALLLTVYHPRADFETTLTSLIPVSSYRLSKREKEWVAASNERPAALLCIRYAPVYARRQLEWLLKECLPGVEYTSQVVDNLHLDFDKVREVFERRMSDPA
jgi:hypothetical protein